MKKQLLKILLVAFLLLVRETRAGAGASERVRMEK
jgi:hypothetical protein